MPGIDKSRARCGGDVNTLEAGPIDGSHLLAIVTAAQGFATAIAEARAAGYPDHLIAAATGGPVRP